MGLIAGNWKMNGSPSSAVALAAGLLGKIATAREALPEVALCPPGPLLSIVSAVLRGEQAPLPPNVKIGDVPAAYTSPPPEAGARALASSMGVPEAIALGAQDCHTAVSGAYTGDVSATLLKEMGCRYVIVGHSERRAVHGETNELVQAKASAAMAAGLIPIICIGETEAERDAAKTLDVIARQVSGSVPQAATAATIVIAYEPVWAIGTGRTPTIGEIEEVHGEIRRLAGGFQGGAGQLRILYGGSVKGSNAAQVLAAKGVDGALVGGASLDLEDFWRIITAAPAK